MIECLEDNQGALAEKCQKQIFRLGELSSDDYHLDRPLFYACKDDREMFCEDVQSGDGKVYKCLKKHKTDGRMSDEVLKKRHFFSHGNYTRSHIMPFMNDQGHVAWSMVSANHWFTSVKT